MVGECECPTCPSSRTFDEFLSQKVSLCKSISFVVGLKKFHPPPLENRQSLKLMPHHTRNSFGLCVDCSLVCLGGHEWQRHCLNLFVWGCNRHAIEFSGLPAYCGAGGHHQIHLLFKLGFAVEKPLFGDLP
jgi:hypothetical protein